MVWPPRPMKPGAPLGASTHSVNFGAQKKLPPSQTPGHAAYKPNYSKAKRGPWSPDSAAGPGMRAPGGGQQQGGGMPAPLYAPGTDLYNPQDWTRLRQMPGTFTGMNEYQNRGPGTNFWNADSKQMWGSGGGVAGLDMNNLGAGWSTNAPLGYGTTPGLEHMQNPTLPGFRPIKPPWQDRPGGTPPWQSPGYPFPPFPQPGLPPKRPFDQHPNPRPEWPTDIIPTPDNRPGPYPKPRPGPWPEHPSPWPEQRPGTWPPQPQPRPRPSPYPQPRSVADNWQDIFGGAVPLRHMGGYADRSGYESPIQWNEARNYEDLLKRQREGGNYPPGGPTDNIELEHFGRRQGSGIMMQPPGTPPDLEALRQQYNRPAYGNVRVSEAERPAYEAFAKYLHAQQQEGFQDFDWGGGGRPWEQGPPAHIYPGGMGGGTRPGTMPGAGSQSPPTVPPWLDASSHTNQSYPYPAPEMGMPDFIPGGPGKHDFQMPGGPNDYDRISPGYRDFAKGAPGQGGNRPEGWGPGPTQNEWERGPGGQEGTWDRRQDVRMGRPDIFTPRPQGWQPRPQNYQGQGMGVGDFGGRYWDDRMGREIVHR